MLNFPKHPTEDIRFLLDETRIVALESINLSRLVQNKQKTERTRCLLDRVFQYISYLQALLKLWLAQHYIKYTANHARGSRATFELELLVCHTKDFCITLSRQ